MIMNVLNEHVDHHQFGAGVITDQTETTVSVKFSELDDLKKFIYPTAFEFYLKLSNPEIQIKINDEIQQIRDQIAAERREREEENKRHRQEELLEKQATIKKVSKVKKATTKKVQKVLNLVKEDPRK